jgi:hypothetical protein
LLRITRIVLGLAVLLLWRILRWLLVLLLWRILRWWLLILLLWRILRWLLVRPCLWICSSSSRGSKRLAAAIAEARASIVLRATTVAECLAGSRRHGRRCLYALSAIGAESAAGRNLLVAGGAEVLSWLRDDGDRR